MSKQRKWGVQDCPNGWYYLADSIDGLYIDDSGYIFDDKDSILAICGLLNEKESVISALKRENERLKNKLNSEKSVISAFKEENEELREKIAAAEEVVAEVFTTLMSEGFDVIVNGENLSELIKNE